MRVIAGQYGGRILEAPKGFKTHPMGERIRGALFNSLGDIAGLSVWDAFAGSGAIALEAASRGASLVVATEKDRKAFEVLKRNVESLRAEDVVKASQANCLSWGKTNPQAEFDIIICDPPYSNLQLSTVFALKAYIKSNGLMVLSYSGRGQQAPHADRVVVVDNRIYGDAALAYYRKK